MSPKITEEEWNDDQMVWLSYREMLAVAMVINEVQRYAPENFHVAPELMGLLGKVKKKLWAEVKPHMLPHEEERLEIDPSLGPG